MNTYRVAVISGGLRTPSSTRLLADELTRATASELDRRGVTAEITTIEVREHAHAIVDAMLTGFATGELAAAIETAAAADALVVVGPTFSAAMSGLLKSFFDIIEPGRLRGKPVLLAATGGTERHSLVIDYSMRPLFAYLGAEPLPTGVFAATADFGGSGAAALSQRVSRAASELAARLASDVDAPAAVEGRPLPSSSATEASAVVPFEEMFRTLTA